MSPCRPCDPAFPGRRGAPARAPEGPGAARLSRRSGTSRGRGWRRPRRDGARSAWPPRPSAGSRARQGSPPPERSARFTSSSSSLSRHRWNRPSAVRRMRLQAPQYGSLTGEMKPTTPSPPSAKRKLRASSEVLAGGSGSRAPERLLDPPPGLRGRDELRQGDVRGLAATERHQLDEPDVPAALTGAARQLHDVGVVVVARHRAVDLHRHEPGLLGRGDARLASPRPTRSA